MFLPAGTKLGPYEIQSALGAGGMGEVFRARDTRLERTVAIKVLNSSLVASPEVRARFEREAKTISQFNHPNICTLYDIGHHDGTDFLVMEFIEGDSLADRLKRGPLPLPELLRIGSEIADALDRAHRAGIVHRDLKPANVMLTKSGCKLLDFGLAKPAMAAAAPAAPLVSAAVTMDGPSPQISPLTTHGAIVGTIQYMSPEQIEGKEADARSDIFALGTVLYEMGTGKRAFEAKSQLSTATAILEKDPEPISAKRFAVPPALEHVVGTCLAKNPDARYQSAVDVKLDLDWIRRQPAVVPAASGSRLRARAWAATVIAAAAMGAIGWWSATRLSKAPTTPMHLAIPLAPGTIYDALQYPLVISPDGQWVVYTVTRDGTRQLFLRGIHEDKGSLLAGTEDAEAPFFSPNSEWIAFGANGSLKKIPVSAGSAIVICGMSSLNTSAGFIGGDWGADDRIIFVPDFNAGIWIVSANGGTPKLLLATDTSKDRVAFTHPQFLPDNKGILYTQVPGRARIADDEDLAVLPTGAVEPHIILHGGNAGHYLPTGQVVFGQGGKLLVTKFDLSRLEVSGTSTPVVDGLQKGLADATFSVSDNGTLLYAPAIDVNPNPRLVLFDQRGNGRPISDETMFAQDLAVSPDGRRVVSRIVATNDDLWTIDLARGTALRLTFEPGDELYPQWTPDGTRIAYGSRFGQMFWRPADGSGQREEISRGENSRYPWSFSPDGKWLAFVEDHPSRQRDIYVMPLTGDRRAEPFQVTDADEFAPKFSPDGQWIAYTSNETGRNEIYLRAFGSSGGRKRISANGGEYAVWSRNGHELFYLKGTKLISTSIDASGNPEGAERVVLDTPTSGTSSFNGGPYFDVMPDGHHFVFALRPKYSPPTYYNVIIDWFDELKSAGTTNR